jgi:hypothetical protein
LLEPDDDDDEDDDDDAIAVFSAAPTTLVSASVSALANKSTARSSGGAVTGDDATCHRDVRAAYGDFE